MKPNLTALLLWVVLSLWACGSSRKVQDTTAVSNIETAVVNNAGKTEAKNCLKTMLDKSVYDVTFTYTTYDTGSVRPDAVVSKAVLSISGRKDIQVHEERSKAIREEHTDVTSQVYADSIRAVDVSEKEETKVPGQVKGIVVWVCVTMLLGIAWVLLKNKV